MCGISGIISKEPLSAEYIQLSLKSIKHRGPDNTLFTDTRKFYTNELSNDKILNESSSNNLSDAKSKVWLGFNRLSIVDASIQAMQPFYDDKTDSYFMLNGEVYNYKQLRQDEFPNTSFQSNSDSEVVFMLYLKYGDAFVKKLQGMFTIVIYDNSKKKIKVWRDRLGIKPFYYFRNDYQFVFSSEVKGILETTLVTKRPNHSGIAYSMYLGTCPSPLTIYKEIFSLRPGHQLTYSIAQNKTEITPYWSLKYEPNLATISAKEFQEDLTKLCELYNTKSHNKALMLSGGIDSGMMAFSFGKVDNTLKVLTLFQGEGEQNELAETRINANNAKLTLTGIKVPEVFSLQNKEKYQRAEEEPNILPEPTLYLSKIAKQENYKVLFNSLGPDELFGGYEYYQRIQKLNKYRLAISLTPTAFLPKSKRIKLQEVKKYGLAYYPLISRQVFNWGEIKEYLHNNGQPVPDHPIIFLTNQIKALKVDFNAMPLLKQASYLDIFYYISSHHTLRSDLPSMSCSIEMRFPYLEHTFIEKYFNQIDTFDHIEGSLKPKMKFYCKDVLPAKILNAPKRGFTLFSNKDKDIAAAQKEWYKASLARIFDDSSITKSYSIV